MKKLPLKKNSQISREEALRKIGDYGKYTALTALGTYLLLQPQNAQAASPRPPDELPF